ncbi:MAG: nucleoside hydrolase, partial [Bacteroidota bacterium]
MKKAHAIPHLFAILLLFIGCYNSAFSQGKLKVILDADTGNEVDDLFAVVRVLLEPSWEVTALNATHWQTSQWAIEQTMENSYRLNAVLAGYLQHDVKQRRGGVARMFDWGDKAQHSAAAYEIIKQAQALPADEKLTVIALGALT